MKDLKDMKRVLLKLSGEALAGDKKTGFDEATCADAARQVKTLVDEGLQVAIVPSNLEENDSSNHKISGYGLVLKDDIIHVPKHTLHIPLILQPAADSSESFYCEYYSFPILFSYLES